MDVAKYELLLKAAEMKNLTKAAAALGYTQSGASHVIRSIEEELGITLLQRDRSGTRLTTEGELLLPSIRELVYCGEKIRTMSQSILGLQTGVLRVATFTTVSRTWLPRILRRFNSLYPNVRVEILSGNGRYQDIENLLLTAQVDCAFVRLPSNDSFDCIPLMRDPLLAVLPPDSPLAKAEEPLTLEQLSHESFLMSAEGANYDLNRIMAGSGFTPQGTIFTIKDAPSQLAMVENGLGCTILSGLFLSNRTHSAVVKRIEGDPYRSIALATRSNTPHSPLVSAFVSLTRQLLSEFRKEQEQRGFPVL